MLRTAAACTHRRGCAGSTANWRSDPLSRVINTRLPTSQPSALLYWARIRERQFPTIHNISRDGSVMYRRDQPLEREDASVILSRTTESSSRLMTDRCGDRERHGIDQQFRAGVQASYFMEAADAGDRGEDLFGLWRAAADRTPQAASGEGQGACSCPAPPRTPPPTSA